MATVTDARLLSWSPQGSPRLGPHIPAAAVTESLSYHFPTNIPRLQQHKAGLGRRFFFGYTGKTAVSSVSTICCGILIGITAAAIQTSIERLMLLRNVLLQHFFSSSIVQALAVWSAISLTLVVSSGWLVQVYAPKAAGAGASLVMAFLNGVDAPGLFSLPVFLLKSLGLICSRLAGLAVGQEGPMVHVGACVASMLYVGELWILRTIQTGSFSRTYGPAAEPHKNAGEAAAQLLHGTPGAHSPKATEHKEKGKAAPRVTFANADHRELVSAGAAAGIAAAFGAPIGGLLFALEEASTYWDRKVGMRCFLCTTCASFTLTQLLPSARSGMLSFKADHPLGNAQSLMQIPFVVLVSVFGGLLGATFNLLRKGLWRVRPSRENTVLRLAEAGWVAVATVAAMVALSLTVGSCLPLPEAWSGQDTMQLTCGKGEYNDLGTAFMSSSVWVICTLLNLGSKSMPITQACGPWRPCYFSWLSLAALAASYLVFMALASSLCVPGGQFMPGIMVGCAFGSLFGFVLLQLLPVGWDIQPGLYALLCATAVLGGVFRSTFSLVVIVVEGTRDIDCLFFIITAVLVSNLVASKVLAEGVYESELERDGNVYYLHREAPLVLHSKAAEDIMATPAVGMEAIVPVEEVYHLLSTTTHNCFVVHCAREPRDAASGGGGRLEGLILRSQLEVLLSRGAYCNAAGEYLSAPDDVAAYEAEVNHEMRAAQATVTMQSHPSRAAWQDAGGSGAATDLPNPAAAGTDGTCWLLPTAGSSQLKAGEWLQPASDDSLWPAVTLAQEPDTPLAQLRSAPSRQPASRHGRSSSPPGTGRAVGAFLNLLPFMDRAPLAVRPLTLASAVHRLFLAMSLRHVCVVDAHNHVVGVITRKDLDHAAGEGWWRVNKIAPTPHHSPQRQQSWQASSQDLLCSISVMTS